MAGINARHAARIRNTSCLATITHQTRAPKTATRIRKNSVLCGSGNQLSGQAAGLLPDGAHYPHNERAADPVPAWSCSPDRAGLGTGSAMAVDVAVEVGFEPTEGLPLHTLSRRAPSATRRLHRGWAYPTRARVRRRESISAVITGAGPRPCEARPPDRRRLARPSPRLERLAQPSPRLVGRRACGRRLAAAGEELAQQAGGLGFEHAADHLDLRGDPAVAQHVPQRTRGARPGI